MATACVLSSVNLQPLCESAAALGAGRCEMLPASAAGEVLQPATWGGGS